MVRHTHRILEYHHRVGGAMVGLLLIHGWSSAALVSPSLKLHGAAAAVPALVARRHQSLLLYTPTDIEPASGLKWLQASGLSKPQATVSPLEEVHPPSAHPGSSNARTASVSSDQEGQEALWPSQRWGRSAQPGS